MKISKHSIFMFSIIFLLLTSLTFSQEITLPIEAQYTLLKKVLNYDRSLKERCGSEIVIGVVYQSRFSASNSTKEYLLHSWENESTNPRILGLPVRMLAIDLIGGELETMMLENEIDILYVMPLRAISIDGIAQISRTHGITTVSSIVEYNYQGLSIGFDLVNKKPKIVINYPAALAEGIDLKSTLLQYAKLIE